MSEYTPTTGKIPIYGMLDVWTALGHDSREFDSWYERVGYAEAWAEICAQVRALAPAAPPKLDPYPWVWEGHSKTDQMRSDTEKFRKGAPHRVNMGYVFLPRPEYSKNRADYESKE
jgi:hypothetical protein